MKTEDNENKKLVMKISLGSIVVNLLLSVFKVFIRTAMTGHTPSPTFLIIVKFFEQLVEICAVSGYGLLYGFHMSKSATEAMHSVVLQNSY